MDSVLHLFRLMHLKSMAGFEIAWKYLEDSWGGELSAGEIYFAIATPTSSSRAGSAGEGGWTR